MPSTDILLVEDDPEHRRLIPMLLKTLPYAIVPVKNASKALEYLETQTPQLILLDVALPGMNGLDLLKQIRQNPRFADTKVIVVTAAATRLIPTDLAGVSRIVNKPFQAAELEGAIRDVLGESMV